MKNIICTIVFVLSCFSVAYPTVKDDFFKDLLKDFDSVITKFNEDYSKVSGLTSSGTAFKGSASCGNFPSFSAGSSFSIVFIDNPLNFMKKINFIGTDWEKISGSINSVHMDWIDDNFLPLPVTVSHFEVGLPKGFFVGLHFNVIPVSSFVGSTFDQFFKLNEFSIWGIGFETGYTIVDDRTIYLPNIAIGIGFDYAETNIDIENISVGGIDIDDDNKNIQSKLSLLFRNKTPSLTTNFAISKKFIFFEPFVDFRFSQSFYYNEIELSLILNTSDMSASMQDVFDDGVFTISNKDSKNVGVLLPVTDFIVSTGFHFDIFGFRLGFGGSWGIAAGEGMVTFDIGAQIEDTVFRKQKSAGGIK